MMLCYNHTIFDWRRGVAVNMPPCQGGDRGFESRRFRTGWKYSQKCFQPFLLFGARMLIIGYRGLRAMLTNIHDTPSCQQCEQVLQCILNLLSHVWESGIGTLIYT